mmetsp:Transcript_30193/g.92349  ORF Transcript_30193/g.92349 Transcript_30193/m.92349 type:complete len:158 (+) Transcript_30193:249-722(+)
MQVRALIVCGPPSVAPLGVFVTNTVSLCQALKNGANGGAKMSKRFFDNATFASDLPKPPFKKDSWSDVTAAFPWLVPNIWVHQYYKTSDENVFVPVDLKKKMTMMIKNVENKQLGKTFGFLIVRKDATLEVANEYLACFERDGLTASDAFVFETSDD